MGPNPAGTADQNLFRTELINLINHRPALVRLAALVDWDAFSRQWSPQVNSTTGQPVLPRRLMAALCGAGHNVRMTLASRRVLSLAFVGQIALAIMLIDVAASLWA